MSPRFLYEGDRINETDTPDSLGMEDGDSIDVMVERKLHYLLSLSWKLAHARALQRSGGAAETICCFLPCQPIFSCTPLSDLFFLIIFMNATISSVHKIMMLDMHPESTPSKSTIKS